MTGEARRVFFGALAVLTVWPYLPPAGAYLRGADLSEGNGGPWRYSLYEGLLYLNGFALTLLSCLVLLTAMLLRLLDRQLMARPHFATLGLIVLPWLVLWVQAVTLWWLVD